ncbi:MAG: DUF4129 domain-containing protein [Chloroflexi bacterium]|nr:DUF4129 domain-containing protein [Chloroflexota bacterium]
MRFARSILSYRVLGFLALSLAVAAVAIASNDPVLFWGGVGGVAAGHLYMWRRRYENSRLRTIVLVLLLLILLIYLARDMFFSLTADRLLLARYLVFGLVVTSFDLRTRRNLLGALVLAGLLLVLLSEMAFGPWFPAITGVFVVLALGAAIIGHQEEEASRAVVVGQGRTVAAVTVWAWSAPGALLLTGVIFMLMPRLTTGGLGQASWLPSRIDLTAGGPTSLPSRPSAAVDPSILASSQFGEGSGRYVQLGYTGSAADRAVMYVRSRVASYWRGATLDVYDGVGWLPSASELTLRNSGRGEYVFPDSEPLILDRRWYSQTYYLVVPQPYAVFTGYNPGRVYLSEESEVFLREGTIYRAISPLPRINPAALRRDLVDPRDVESLALPTLSPRVASLAEFVVAGALTDYDKAARLEKFLYSSYPYDLKPKPLPPGRDGVDFFLFEQQAGYCSQFATAMAAMARHVGLPARVAIGYAPGVYDQMTGAYTVRAGDAHAWVEVRFRNSGWVAFDPTPRSDLVPSSGPRRGLVSVGLLELVGPSLSGTVASLGKEGLLARLPLFRRYALALLGVIVAAGLLGTLFLSLRRGQPPKGKEGYTSLMGDHRRAVVDAYHRMVALLARKGLPTRRPAQTPQEYAGLVAPRLGEAAGIVEWLAEAASTAAYDPRPISSAMASEASGRLALLKRTLVVRVSGSKSTAQR